MTIEDLELFQKAGVLIKERKETADYSRWPQAACLYAKGYMKLYQKIEKLEKQNTSLLEVINGIKKKKV